MQLYNYVTNARPSKSLYIMIKYIIQTSKHNLNQFDMHFIFYIQAKKKTKKKNY